MTNKEYLTKLLNGLSVSEDDIDIIMLKSGLDADAVADVPYQCWKPCESRALFFLKFGKKKNA